MAEPYLETLSQLVAGLGLAAARGVALECRHFFSGAALYANGKICATLTPAGLGLKLPPQARERMIAGGEGLELRYFEGAPVKKSYIALSKDIAEDPERLKALLEQSIRHVTWGEQAG